MFVMVKQTYFSPPMWKWIHNTVNDVACKVWKCFPWVDFWIWPLNWPDMMCIFVASPSLALYWRNTYHVRLLDCPITRWDGSGRSKQFVDIWWSSFTTTEIFCNAKLRWWTQPTKEMLYHNNSWPRWLCMSEIKKIDQLAIKKEWPLLQDWEYCWQLHHVPIWAKDPLPPLISLHWIVPDRPNNYGRKGCTIINTTAGYSNIVADDREKIVRLWGKWLVDNGKNGFSYVGINTFVRQKTHHQATLKLWLNVFPKFQT